MTYTVIDAGNHVCELPDPESFGEGARIQCDMCKRIYWRLTKVWSRGAYWYLGGGW